jgi:hypothetical protein
LNRAKSISKTLQVTLLLLAWSSNTGFADTDVVSALLETWQVDATDPFSAEAGRLLWYQEVEGRSCTSCHGESVRGAGRHQRTGKVIEPIAPSVNPLRLTEAKKINKWLLRNCKWTFGRECSGQEKGDILTWLQLQ